MIEHVTASEAWEALRADTLAQLCDVRTAAEWAYVGLPDLAACAKQPLLICWQVYPEMQIDAGFVDKLAAAGMTPAHRLYFLCRSGVRSLAAAEAARAAGYAAVFNIADGFEGPLDAAGHRGTRAGWKAAGLPWQQR